MVGIVSVVLNAGKSTLPPPVTVYGILTVIPVASNVPCILTVVSGVPSAACVAVVATVVAGVYGK